jgi:inosine-uridine nucleoside N-ribohydrolase
MINRMIAAAALMLAIALVGVGAAAVPVWIDTDPAIGEPERDVDDGVALVQAFHSPELDIRGVSVVFGNAALDRGLPIARRLVADYGPAGLGVFSGAAAAADITRETDASRALAAALRAEPLTIVALGPATNIATVLSKHPELASRITRVIAVAGRRPGQRFTTGTANKAGHRDFNFELDPHAFQILLDSKVEIVLAPFEISSKIWLRAEDLDRLAASRSVAARSLAAPARQWLALWKKLFAVDGFNPFDTLAVAYAISANGFACEPLMARIETLPDDVTEPGVQGVKVDRKPYLLAASRLPGAVARVSYCSSAPATFKEDLLRRLEQSMGPAFDHEYAAYAKALRGYVRPPRVNYAALLQDPRMLDAAIASFNLPSRTDEQHWTRPQRMAFWINAYNAFTVRAIVDHYPIQSSWLSALPRLWFSVPANSIRRIDGVWTKLTWQAAGRRVTLDDIEHKILRPEFREPRVHFTINCASVGCPPLAAVPYRAATLDAQLDEAARRYLASAQGLRVDGGTLYVSKILEWYGEDFVPVYAPDAAGKPDRLERAARAVVARYGPPAAAVLAGKDSTRVRYLDYDWSLNDLR